MPLTRVGKKQRTERRARLRAEIRSAYVTMSLLSQARPFLFLVSVILGIASSPRFSVEKPVQNVIGDQTVIWKDDAWRDKKTFEPILAIAPTAVITKDATVASKMAPFILGVHACNSTAGTGTLATCQFIWIFTNVSGTPLSGTMTYYDPRPGHTGEFFNGFVDQRGFNARCRCDSAGTVGISLQITNELGESTIITDNTTVVVADDRVIRYCDEGLLTGTGDGTSPANAFKSWEGVGNAAEYLLNSGATEVHMLFNRGKTYANTAANVITGANGRNVWISAYGTGANPKVIDSQSSGGNTIWDVRRDSENVIVENIDFQGHASRVANALRFRTDTKLVNVAIIGCNFSSVAQATNTTENPNYIDGFLQMNCVVDNHAEYGFYGEYDDFVSLGCTSTNSAQQNESSIRTSGFRMSWDCTYSKFIHPTSNKDAFRVMTRDPTHGAEYVWITRSHFIGPVELAWNSDAGNPATGKFQVLEDSLLQPNDFVGVASNTWLNVGGSNGSSYADIAVRQNVFYYIGNQGNVATPIAAGTQQASARMVIIDNTVVVNDSLADLMSMNVNTDTFRVERNLFISSATGKAFFFKSGAAITAGNNVWYTTGAIVNVSGEGNMSLAAWNARTGTATDFAQTSPQIAYTDVTSPVFRPADTFTTVHGGYAAPAGARNIDYHGRVRVNGSAGAVDASPGGGHAALSAAAGAFLLDDVDVVLSRGGKRDRAQKKNYLERHGVRS